MDESTLNELALSMIEDTVGDNIYEYCGEEKSLLATLAEISGILRFARALNEAIKG